LDLVTAPSTWDHEVDLLVIGSGAAAMTAAIRAHDLGSSVLLVEKGAVYGGSTAMSGGVCWVGNNPHMTLPDSDAETLTYLEHVTEGEVPKERLQTYVTESRRMLAYLEQHSHVRYEALHTYTDYYPEAPGGKMGGRSMEPAAFDGALLGEQFRTLQRPARSALVLGMLMIKAAAAKDFVRMAPTAMLLLLWCFFRYALRWPKRRRYARDTYLTNGNALAGRLRMSLIDREVPLWLSAPATQLVVDQGRVVGAVVERDGTTVRVRAQQGVLVASGGFERNLAMRKEHGPAPASTEWTAGSEHNTGDGIRMGAQANGALDLMGEAWWTPTTQYPGATTGWVLVVEKSLPGGIFVNGKGERFTNEAGPYVDVAKAMYADHEATGCTVPGWMVFDATYRKRYIAGPVGPGRAMPDRSLPRKIREHFLVKAPSLAELASKLEMPAEALTATVDRFNGFARSGVDEDFGRGNSASDRYYGDDRAGDNPCLAPLERGPYYAIRVFPGDLGTKGGLRTDSAARVLDANNQVVAGLFAAGNASASVMGRTYPGAGGTIGPAMCFGFLAAETAHAEASQHG
jgi:3-oxosteroid 1-dehydrogenase